MKISVIVPTYNRPEALNTVLTGLMRQSRPPDEVIVADDGSGDPTRLMVDTIREQAPFPLRHIWHPDRGYRLSQIRNRAIRASTGAYLIMLDGDCLPHPRFVADHLRLAEPGCFFQGKRVLLGRRTAANLDPRRFPAPVLRALLSRDIGNRHHLVRLPLFPALKTRKLGGVRGCNMGFYRADLLAVNGYNQDFVGWGREDSELVVRLYRLGLIRKEHPFRAVCFHLWHPENDRSRLEINDALLRSAQASDQHVCINGIRRIVPDADEAAAEKARRSVSASASPPHDG